MAQPPRPASSTPRAKILSLAELMDRRARARAAGQRVVQCHGCFDIVHPGHIRHLRQAKSHGDILLVSITADAAYTKREGAPLIPEDHRADNLAELDCVDWVYIEPLPTAVDLLTAVKPDVYVKGKEYEANSDPRFAAERAAVETAGGRVVFSSGDVVFSSTALIAAMAHSADPYDARLAHLLSRPDLSPQVLTPLISSFKDARVLVVGETIIDTYALCDAQEVADESPVLTLRPLEYQHYDGGAAIIARHLAALGARPTLLTALPRSGTAGAELVSRLNAQGVEVCSIPMDQPLAQKQRFLVGNQKILKINNLSPIVLDATSADALVHHAGRIASGTGVDPTPFDAAIVADFGNGLLSAGLIERLGMLLRPLVRTLAGDVSGMKAPLLSFRHFDLVSPSEKEARGATRSFDESLPAVAWRVLESTGVGNLFITLGGDGLIAFSPLPDAREDPLAPAWIGLSETGQPTVAESNRSRVRGEHVPALTSVPLDPLGCGDALLAASTLTLARGGSALQAALLGALGASCEAQRLGNHPIAASDLKVALARLAQARLAFTPAGTVVTQTSRVPELLAS